MGGVFLYRRKRVTPKVNEDWERRKRQTLIRQKQQADAARAKSQAQAERERLCGKSPLGHVYELADKQSYRDHTDLVCVGCGKHDLRLRGSWQ